MIEPWNSALLEPPPVNTFRCSKKSIVDLLNLNCILNDVKDILSSQSHLHQEAAIVSRLIYKFDKKFRHDIGYQNLKKVNTALKKYRKVNLLKDIENFSDVVPLPDSNEEYLPTRQMLQYILIRILSMSKIMVRVIVCAKVSAIFYWDRVTRGESHWMSLMPYSVMSRIWSLCSIFLKQCCQWYTKLYSFHDKLNIYGAQFLPQGYSLPAHIDLWLDIANIDEHGKFHWANCKHIDISSCLEEEEDNIDSIDIFQYVQDVKNEASDIKDPREYLESKEIDIKSDFKHIDKFVPRKRKIIEFGEKISRENLKNISSNNFSNNLNNFDHVKLAVNNEPPEKKIKTFSVSVSNHSLDSVHTKIDVKLFVAKEERFRNGKNSQALSSHLSFMQWQSLKLAVNNLCNGELSDSKISKQFKTIWKNKCTDYIE